MKSTLIQDSAIFPEPGIQAGDGLQIMANSAQHGMCAYTFITDGGSVWIITDTSGNLSQTLPYCYHQWNMYPANKI